MVFRGLGPGSPPDILARTGYGHRMAPVRVRGCVGVSVSLGRPGHSSGKPMPGAGETAHVRRLFVDRSRCALEVSPAPRRVPMSLTTGRRAVVADKSGETLSRRMWGRRPGRPDGWHPIGGLAMCEPPGIPSWADFPLVATKVPFPSSELPTIMCVGRVMTVSPVGIRTFNRDVIRAEPDHPQKGADRARPFRPPNDGRCRSQPGRRLLDGHAMKGVLWTSSSRVDAPV